MNCKKFLKKKDSFIFRGKIYDYFKHSYNNTYLNERIVEIPICFEFMKEFHDKKILEVGNVLFHYFKQFNHEIIDKYEKSINKNVKNIDINKFKTNIKYDLIRSYSNRSP